MEPNIDPVFLENLDMIWGRFRGDFLSRLRCFPRCIKYLEEASHKWPWGIKNRDKRSESLHRSLVEALAAPEAEVCAGAIHGIAVLVEPRGPHDPPRIFSSDGETNRKAVAGLCTLVTVRGTSPAARIEALRVLEVFCQIGGTEVVEASRICLDDQDPEVRAAACSTLRAYVGTAPVSVVRALIPRIEQLEDGSTAQQFCKILLECGPDAASEAVECLTQVLSDSERSPEVRTAVCETLEWLGADAHPAADTLLTTVLATETDNRLCQASMSALLAVVNLKTMQTMLTDRKLTEEQQDHILSVLRHLGEKGRECRRALASTWRSDFPPVSVEPSGAAQEQAEREREGPVGPNGFRWNGRTYEGLPPVPFRLVQYLWSQENRFADFDDLAGPVWGDQAGEVDTSRVGSARKVANKFFEKHNIPFRVTLRRFQVWLREQKSP